MQDVLQSSAAGIFAYDRTNLGPTMLVQTAVPAQVRNRISTSARFSLATDGTAWAWWDGSGFDWWQPGSAVRHISARFQPDGDDRIVVVRVAGPFVLFELPQQAVIDMRTGGIATLPDYVYANGGPVMVTLQVGQHVAMSVVDTTGLPQLTC